MGLITDLVRMKSEQNLKAKQGALEASKLVLSNPDATPEAREWATSSITDLLSADFGKTGGGKGSGGGKSKGGGKGGGGGLGEVFHGLITGLTGGLSKIDPYSASGGVKEGVREIEQKRPQRLLMRPEEAAQRQESIKIGNEQREFSQKLNTNQQLFEQQQKQEQEKVKAQRSRLDSVKDLLSPEEYRFALAEIEGGVKLPAPKSASQRKAVQIAGPDGKTFTGYEGQDADGTVHLYELGSDVPLDPSQYRQESKSAPEIQKLVEARRIMSDPKASKEEKAAAQDVVTEQKNKEKGQQVRINLGLQNLGGDTGAGGTGGAGGSGTGGAGGTGGVPDTNGRFPQALDKSGLTGGQKLIVKQLVDYHYPLPSSFALRAPYWQKILAAAAAYDPTFNAAQYQVRLKLMQDFTSGKAANNIRSLNTAVGHLDTLRKAADKLKNSPIQLWNRIANTGITSTGDPRVTNFLQAANAVESELATAFKGTAGTDQEIKAWRANLSDAQSPEQLHGAIDTAVELLNSRVNALREQYEAGMGRPPTQQFLTPESQKVIQKLTGRGATPATAVAPATTAAPATSGTDSDPLGVLK